MGGDPHKPSWGKTGNCECPCSRGGVEGLILAGTGSGGIYQAWLEPLKQAHTQGVALVRASRTGAGPTTSVQDDLLCQSAEGLNPPKARIALQLALNDAKANPKSLTWQDFLLE